MEYKRKTKDQPLKKTSEIQQLLAQTEQYQNLTSQVLELLNQTDSKTDLIKEILFLVKAATGFEAVGIRLREGEDFPYYETIGFSKDFVKSERYLCARDQTGELIRDSDGNPYLECMCGNILCGRTNPSLPFFTKGGSFWTNSTTALLASATEEDRQGRTRNRCNGEGYESAALIPLHSNKEIIGILQLNDRRKNLFTLQLIHFLEVVCSSIGIAFKLKQREGNLLRQGQSVPPVDGRAVTVHDGNWNYHDLFQHSPVSIWEEDFSEIRKYMDTLKNKGVTDFRAHFKAHPEDVLSLSRKVRIVGVNEATVTLFQAKNKEELLRGLNNIFNKEAYDVFREELIALSQGKTEFQSQAVNLTLTGKEKTVLLKVVVPPGHEETLARVFVYIIDVSDLKGHEEQMKESEEKYRMIVEATHDAIILVDMETGIIIDSNKKTEELLELAKHEIAGTHLSQLHPEEVLEDYRMILRSPTKEGITIPRTLFACKKCNKNIPVSVSSRVITLKGKKYISAIFRELTGKDNKEENALRSLNFKETGTLSSAKGKILSKRECEILSCIASGLSAKEISARLFISERTVTTHRSKIMQKLDMHKSSELVRYAVDCGLAGEGLQE